MFGRDITERKKNDNTSQAFHKEKRVNLKRKVFLLIHNM